VVMKAHQSHDVLLLCPICHEISNSHDLQLRRKLADMCDAPLIGPMSHVRDKYINNYQKLHSAVKALNERLSIPQRRREELESYILEYTGQQKITPDLLDTLNKQLKTALIQQPILNQCKYQPHGLKVFIRSSRVGSRFCDFYYFVKIILYHVHFRWCNISNDKKVDWLNWNVCGENIFSSLWIQSTCRAYGLYVTIKSDWSYAKRKIELNHRMQK